MPVFTKVHAQDTAKKLKTKPTTAHYPRLEVTESRDGPHVLQHIWCNGQLIDQFGIKHASNRNDSHGWVARTLDLSPRQMYDFAVCHMSIDEMIEHFAARGDIAIAKAADAVDAQEEQSVEP